MSLTPEERERIRETVGRVYADGFAEGMGQVAQRYDLGDAVPPAATTISRPLEQRMDVVTASVNRYLDMIDKKAEQLRAAGVTGDALAAQVSDYARNLAESKSSLIAETEHAQARLDGAGAILDEADLPHKWRFPHFDLGSDHEECPVCVAIREGAPYSTDEAEREGFPSYPHPGCD
jgi:hypothetical protein